jgi:hypothetical protein
MNAFKALNPRATRGTTATQSCRMLTNRERPKVGSRPSREHVAAPPNRDSRARVEFEYTRARAYHIGSFDVTVKTGWPSGQTAKYKSTA